MFLLAFRRSSRRRYTRAALLVATLACLLDLLSLLSAHKTFTSNLQSTTITTLSALPAALHDLKLFVAATHWNNGAILASHWNAAVLDLITTLGPENTYVSIAESGSWDDTKTLLLELDRALASLGALRTISLDERSHADDLAAGPPPPLPNGETPGWIAPHPGSAAKHLRRIPYLSRLRNLSLAPLNASFTHILFLNDVAFTTPDILTLLATHHGAYSAACALDFKDPQGMEYYDTFALRDATGLPTISQKFPFFRARPSRDAMLQGRAAQVKSCWNGAAVMPARLFLDDGGVQFRGVADSLATRHVEGSECCLVHADVAAAVAQHPDDDDDNADQGVWVNPAVRVGYSGTAYNAVHPAGPGGAGGWWWMGAGEYVAGVWRNRGARWTGTGWWWAEWVRRCAVRRRVRAWEAEGAAREEGEDEDGRREVAAAWCLVDEMQVLVENGWKHI
jgi:hypothetical protein